jgi:hypothetical protein
VTGNSARPGGSSDDLGGDWAQAVAPRAGRVGASRRRSPATVVLEEEKGERTAVRLDGVGKHVERPPRQRRAESNPAVSGPRGGLQHGARLEDVLGSSRRARATAASCCGRWRRQGRVGAHLGEELLVLLGEGTLRLFRAGRRPRSRHPASQRRAGSDRVLNPRCETVRESNRGSLVGVGIEMIWPVFATVPAMPRPTGSRIRPHRPPSRIWLTSSSDPARGEDRSALGVGFRRGRAEDDARSLGWIKRLLERRWLQDDHNLTMRARVTDLGQDPPRLALEPGDKSAARRRRGRACGSLEMRGRGSQGLREDPAAGLGRALR